MILHHIICQIPIVIHQNIHWQYSYSHELGSSYHYIYNHHHHHARQHCCLGSRQGRVAAKVRDHMFLERSKCSGSLQKA